MDREQKIHHLKSKIEEAFSGSFVGDEKSNELLADIGYLISKKDESFALKLAAIKGMLRAEKEKQKATLLSLIDDLPPDFFDSLRGEK